MSLINISQARKFYGRQDVLKGVDLHINPGERLGLIGANGAGKTTLLRLVLDEESPDQGQVHKAKGLRLGYLPQDLMSFSGQSLLDLVMNTAENIRAIEVELDFIVQDIEAAAQNESAGREALLELTARQSYLLELYENAGGYTLEIKAKKILQGLGFNEQDFQRSIDSFSGGWIMRAVLARLLLSEPDVLLLDEPTNHLDMDSLLWLENYLQSTASALLLVSHDRVFLNNVVQRIVEVERGHTFSYSGNYEDYLKEKERRRTAEMAAYESQQDKIRQAEKFIERNRVRAATARRAQARLKALEKMDKLEAPVQEDKTIRLNLPPAARTPEILCQLSGLTKAYGRHTVYHNLDFTIRRGDRIAFLGANGLGKSTLMKLIAGKTDFQAGTRRLNEKVIPAYFAQFQLEELNPDRTVLEELDTVAGDLSPGRLRSILGGFLFRADDVFKKVSVLSGGEKSRLILAKIMLTGPNLLLLDEPTNHLDIPGRDMLEKALEQYTATLCLISHDRRLINAVANKVLVINDKRVEVFPGNFDDYHRLWQNRLAAFQVGQPAGPEDVPESPQTAHPASLKTSETRAEREARKKDQARARQRFFQQRAPLEQELSRLEDRQARLTEELDQISQALAEPTTYQDPGQAKTLTQQHARLKAEIEEITTAWEETAIKLEELEETFTTGSWSVWTDTK